MGKKAREKSCRAENNTRENPRKFAARGQLRLMEAIK